MNGVRALVMALAVQCVLIGCDSTSNIENPNSSYFIKFYGQDGDQTGQDLVVLPDGSMVLFGTSRSTVPTRGTQWYLVKVDVSGNLLWEKEFGGPNDEEASDIELTSNGLLALVGNYYKTPADRDVLVMTMTLDGVKVDSALHATRDGGGAPTSGDENAVSITEVIGGVGSAPGFLISGSTTYVGLGGKPDNLSLPDLKDALKIRVNSDLSVYPNSWVQTVGFDADDASQKIIEVSPSLYYVFGYTNNVGTGNISNYNFWVFPLGLNGDPTSEQLNPGVGSSNEKLSSFSRAPVQAPFEGFFLGGFSQSASPSDFYVAKMRESISFGAPTTNPPVSDVVFEKPLSINLGSNLTEKTAIAATMDGGLLVMGIENGFDSNQNWVLTKVNFDGSLAWSIPIVFGGEGMDTCGGIQELPDGRIVMVGTMRTGRPDAGEFKLTLVKVNASGKFER